MESMNDINIFKYYQQKENQFTNGLFSIFNLSKIEDKNIINNFLKKFLKIKIPKKELNFKVLGDYEGTSDAEISNDKMYLLIETKIKSGSLRDDQIKNYLKIIKKKRQRIKGLILLTPDNSESNYIKQIQKINQNLIYHFNWKKVYDFMENYIKFKKKTLFTEIINQYLFMIHDTIFDQDIIAVIVKINFGDESEVYPDEYLNEMKKGKWTEWGTPRFYKNLDGQGRKLILYDRYKKALTVEVEIKDIKKISTGDYPYRNKFVSDTLKIYKKPISINKIQKIKGFENYGIHRKDRNPYRNFTHEQYKELKKYIN